MPYRTLAQEIDAVIYDLRREFSDDQILLAVSASVVVTCWAIMLGLLALAQ